MVLAAIGCQEKPVPIYNHASSVPKPARPVLPIVQPAALMCLDDETYKELLLRDTLRRQYAEKLEVLINESTVTNE